VVMSAPAMCRCAEEGRSVVLMDFAGRFKARDFSRFWKASRVLRNASGTKSRRAFWRSRKGAGFTSCTRWNLPRRRLR